jgi:hypothetical protein
MKNKLIGMVVGGSLATLFAFQWATHSADHSAAQSTMVEGFYIFSDSKPVMAHDTLGIVTLGFVKDTQYESIRDNLIRRARKSYGEANGLILQLSKKGLDQCVVIQFK